MASFLVMVWIMDSPTSSSFSVKIMRRSDGISNVRPRFGVCSVKIIQTVMCIRPLMKCSICFLGPLASLKLASSFRYSTLFSSVTLFLWPFFVKGAFCYRWVKWYWVLYQWVAQCEIYLRCVCVEHVTSFCVCLQSIFYLVYEVDWVISFIILNWWMERSKLNLVTRL